MAASGNSEEISFAMPFPSFAMETNKGANVEFDLDAKPPNFEEFFIRATQRGLNDAEFSAIIKYISSSDISVKDKKRLLEYAVPISVAPEEPFKDFLYWFFPKYNTMEKTLVVNILKWLIDLLYNQLASSDIVNIFYFDLFVILDYQDFYKYACVLLCKLTKPKDVTRHKVKTVTDSYRKYEDSSNGGRFVLAVLQVFKGFKPNLVPDPLKSVDIEKTFSTVHSGNFIMKIGYRRQQNPGVLKDLPACGKVNENKINPLSKLIPCPTFKIVEENVSDAICFPECIEEAFALIKKPPIVNILSYLRDETGFFMLLTEGEDTFERFSMILFQKLQDVFILQEIECTEEDKEIFLNRVYEIQVFMRQGIPSVSQFFMGYLIKWDGIDHRSQIMKLLEWVVFDEFKWLSANILRPFYMLFVTSNATLKHQIIRGFTNLLKNMFAAIEEREISSHPLEKQPVWKNDKVRILSSLIKWVEEMIRIGLCLEEDDNLLLQSVHFYETVNTLESKCNLPLWTIVSKGVAFRSAFNHTPVILNRVCRLILSYHTAFLPNLRATQPDFYKDCKEKMCVTLKCAQELIAMWNGQEVSPGSENERIVSKKAIRFNLGQNLGPSTSRVDVDTLFDLSHSANWLPYVIRERNQNGPDFLKNNEDYLINIEFHLEHFAAFIQYFSPKSG